MSISRFRILAARARSGRTMRAAMGCALLSLAAVSATAVAGAQTVNMFPKDYQKAWTRIPIPPTKPAIPVDQWHINAKKGEIMCDGDKGHEWLRFNHELANFDFKVEWRFTPVPGTTKYNSGVFFRNNKDGAIWHQAQTSLGGGYIFANMLVDGKMQRVNLQKEMTENRVKPAGEWNAFDIHCVGKTCTLAVNGKVVNTLHLTLEKGYVGLEAEGYQITFRKFHLEELP